MQQHPADGPIANRIAEAYWHGSTKTAPTWPNCKPPIIPFGLIQKMNTSDMLLAAAVFFWRQVKMLQESLTELLVA